MYLYRYTVNSDGRLTYDMVPVINTFRDAETNTPGYFTEKGKVVEFYDFDRPGKEVWLKERDDGMAIGLISSFYEGVLEEQKRAVSSTKALLKALAAQGSRKRSLLGSHSLSVLRGKIF